VQAGALVDPLHVSVVQTLPSSVQEVPEPLTASTGQVVAVPVQASVVSHSLTAERHTAPALPAGCVHVALEPSHLSSVQGLESAVHAVPSGSRASPGHDVLAPLQVSTGSHSPADARHSVPALPAGCWQRELVPSQRSSVQTLLSAVHAVALAFLASLGQLADDPVHDSARSHSPAAARHSVDPPESVSVGQLVAVPLHVSAGSHGPALTRHVVPELPAGCWHRALEPSH
jgi:hypothetical protein